MHEDLKPGKVIHGDSQVMPGVYRGVPKHSTKPIVDGIVSGIPRRAHVPAATPTEAAPGSSATHVPKAAFGSGIFQEGAGPVGHGKSSREPPAHSGTKKGEVRKTARRAYEK
jgi:hypothetical protein